MMPLSFIFFSPFRRCWAAVRVCAVFGVWSVSLSIFSGIAGTCFYGVAVTGVKDGPATPQGFFLIYAFQIRKNPQSLRPGRLSRMVLLRCPDRETHMTTRTAQHRCHAPADGEKAKKKRLRKKGHPLGDALERGIIHSSLQRAPSASGRRGIWFPAVGICTGQIPDGSCAKAGDHFDCSFVCGEPPTAYALGVWSMGAGSISGTCGIGSISVQTETEPGSNFVKGQKKSRKADRFCQKLPVFRLLRRGSWTAVRLSVLRPWTKSAFCFHSRIFHHINVHHAIAVKRPFSSCIRV